MRYAYKADGEVTGLNREGGDGESTGNVSPQELTKGLDTTWYWVVDENFTVLSEAEQEANQLPSERGKALEDMIKAIDLQNAEENLKDFQYAKPEGEEYNYVADKDSLTSVAVETADYTESDPIPVPNGVWKTNDTSDGLTPIYIPYTCGEFKGLKSALFTRASSNFGVKEFHKNNVKALYAAEATPAEIRAYDYSQGWY